jgi:transcriptional regulator with XRE-family HTH domain
MDMDAHEPKATFAGRLKQVVSDYGSANSLAKAICRSEGAVRNWLSGKSEPGVSDLVAVCRQTGARLEWLVIGRGPRKESEITGVREDGASYYIGAPDERLLSSITEAVERELNTQLTSLLPAKKAELLVNCYYFIGSADKFDRRIVARLVKLAM